MGANVIVHQGSNIDPNPGPAGVKPYEMADRREKRTPLITFGDVSDWVVEGHDAEGWLYRSKEQRLYRDTCGKLVYRAKGASPWLFVRPKKPIPIADPWDAMNFWNYGNNWGWAPDPKTPPLHVSAVLEDADGKRFELGLDVMNYTYWFVQNARLHEPVRSGLKRPARFVGFKFTNARNTDKRTVYLGPCYFFKEELRPLTFEPWPKKLPFPTRPETILPTNKCKVFRNETRKDGDAVVFRYVGDDATLAYRYEPKTGTLDDITLLYDGKTIHPCAQGGLCLTTADHVFKPKDKTVRRTLKSEKLADNVLTAVWTNEANGEATTITYRLRMLQKSLIVEMESDKPTIESAQLGRVAPAPNAKLFAFPYWTYGGRDPRVLYANGLFLATQFDWYVSNASQLYGAEGVGADFAICNGSARYVPKTNGERNPLRERLFINVSPDAQEVLPSIPNPKSPLRDAQADRQWRVRSGDNYSSEIANARQLRFYGCDNVTVRYHENTWRDAGESFTFRLHAAPKKGGDATLGKFVAAVKSLGWRVGLYTNYTDFAPVNSYWNEDWVNRLPNGDWQRAWMRCYAPKPMFAVQMEAFLAPKIHSEFDENHNYCDVHTCVTPFARVDYDARVPGAGTFRRTYECFGRLLYNEKFAHHGPVYSEGTNHWWYAGLTDGNYAQIHSGAPPREPLLVDFDLLKMHPLEMDAGMGAPGMFFRSLPRNLDQFIATTLAYGHIGFVEWSDLHGALRIYSMLQPIQNDYVMIPVSRIEYDRDGKLVDTSEALITGAYKHNRVHVRYESGLDVFVNGSATPWTVTARGKTFTLPQWGYVATADDGKISCSATVPVGGAGCAFGPKQRVDYCIAPKRAYADSRGAFVFADRMAVEGAAALVSDHDKWWVIPSTQCRDFAFDPALMSVDEKANFTVVAVNADGTERAAPECRWSRGLFHVLSENQKDVKYRIESATGGRPAALPCETVLAAIGSTVEIVPPPGVPAPNAKPFWEVDGKKHPARITKRNDTLVVDVPASIPPEKHLWLGVPAKGKTLWLDFRTIKPFTMDMSTPKETEIEDDGAVPLTVHLHSAVGTPVTVELRCSATGGASVDPSRVAVTMQPYSSASAVVSVKPPRQPGRFVGRVRATCKGVVLTQEIPLILQNKEKTLIDCLDLKLPLVKGHCDRGGQEVIGLPTTHDGSVEMFDAPSGGVARHCLFMHPPWGGGRAGYTFVRFPANLPQTATALVFSIGMRDGLAPSDGVTFKVVVFDAQGKAHRLFAEHYAKSQWKPERVDLSAFAGQKIQIKLIADCGPNDNTQADHSLWAAPKIVYAHKQWIVERAEK